MLRLKVAETLFVLLLTFSIINISSSTTTIGSFDIGNNHEGNLYEIDDSLNQGFELFDESSGRERQVSSSVSLENLKKKFFSSAQQKIIPLRMNQVSNSNASCLVNDPCSNFDQLFENVKLMMENITTTNDTSLNILFTVNIDNDLILENYGNFNLSSNSLISYFFIFQSSNTQRKLTFSKKGYWKLTRNDISWILFNNLEIRNLNLMTTLLNTNFGYLNTNLKSCEIQHIGMGQAEDMFIIESSEIFNSYIAVASTSLTLFKLCKFHGQEDEFTNLQFKLSNLIVFESISMNESEMFASIENSINVMINQGTFYKAKTIISMITVSNIFITQVEVIECSKEALVFSIMFGDKCSIVDSKFQRSGSVVNVRGVKTVQIQNVVFDGNEQTIAASNAQTSPISFNIIDILYLINVKVENHFSRSFNTTFALSIRDVLKLQIQYCNFMNNRIGALRIHNPIFSESYQYEAIMSETSFVNNNCSADGCALSMETIFKMTVYECLFENNYSSGLGGAIFAMNLQMCQVSNCRFLNNEARGSGGAIFVGGITLSPNDILNCTFIRNKAIKAGGALYFEKSGLSNTLNQIKDSSFIDNSAVYGGAIYTLINLSRSFVNSCTFSNNQASKFGNDFLSMPLNFKADLLTEIQLLKPGQSITLKIVGISADNESIPLDSLPSIWSERTIDERIYINVEQRGDKLIVTPYVVNTPEIDKEYSFNVSFSSVVASIVVVNCSQEEELKPFALTSMANVYACEKIPKLSLTLFLAILIPVSVIVFGLGILMTICIMKGMVHIRKRLVLLREKEFAEKSVEKRIIDKRIIFGDSYEPLIDESENYNKHYGRELMQSFVIPISDLTIERKLAEGGQGVVYVGNWNDSTVAIKSLKSDQSESFETEVSLLASLRHPSILIFYGISIAQDSKYMITEYLPGGSLEKLIYSSKVKSITVTFMEKINMLKDIASGMNYLHCLNPPIIHRDLKPANVLLDKNNRCKIADFGLSLPLSQSNTTMTKNIGTFLYMAPEVISSSNTTSNSDVKRSERAPKIDVYSFGIIAWELFFEVSPYSLSEKVKYSWENSIGDIISKALKGERPSIPFSNEIELGEWLLVYPVVHGNLPKDVLLKSVLKYCEIVRQCWHSNPMERPSFAQIIQMLNELASICELTAKNR